jgi:uncharacterized protein YhfF
VISNVQPHRKNMIPPQTVLEFWNAFVATGAGNEQNPYESFAFGNSEKLASALAALVLSGTKRATTSAVWSYEISGQRLPAPGDQSIVTNWDGQPICIIETTQVDVMPLNQVSAEFAAVEGEGDGSLSFWVEGHRRYFSRECERAGQAFCEEMLVACERFKVVYPPTPPIAATGLA